MKIKKFTAGSLKEGKEKILKELGEDAVVLSSRTVKKPDSEGIIYEIVAAVDDTLVKPVKSEYKRSIRKDSIADSETSTEELSDENKAELLKNTGQIFNEIGALKDMIESISESVKYRYSEPLGPVFGKVYKALVSADFSENYALNIAGKLSSGFPNIEQDKALEEARKLIVKNIRTLPPLEKGDKRKIVTFTGSTGCGKTTSLVKLAIVMKLVLESDVMVVSADTEKVGGAEQLQTYASIAGIPFRVVYTGEEIKKLLNEENSRDFILIDTTGVSQKDFGKIKEIKDIIDAAGPDYNFLVISAVTGSSVVSQILENFEILKPSALIISKLDEAPVLGNIIESLKNVSLPVAYITNGQKIPDDIEPADTRALSKIVLPDNMFGNKNGI